MIYRRISHEADKGCGLHYEIYNYRFLDGLLNYIEYLNEKDADILIKYANSKGTDLDKEAYRKAILAKNTRMEDIYQNQI